MSDFNRRSYIHSYLNCKENYLKFENLPIGDYEIVKKTDLKDKKNNYLYKLKCSKCNEIIYKTADDIQRNKYNHCTQLCGKLVYKEKIGNIYEDMKIIDYINIANNGNPIYLCKCQVCKRIKNMRLSNLEFYKGTSHNNCSKSVLNTPYCEELRKKWCDMRQRTTNPLCDHYKSYGARGISSDAYKYYIDFYDDMYESFIEHINLYGVDNTTLERINVDKNYDKDNIKWITWEEQFNNKQNTIYFKVTDVNGETNIYRNVSKYEKDNNLTQKRK